MASIKLVVFTLIIAATLIISCNCQLTFTPTWGKRSSTNLFNSQGIGQNGNCKTATDSLLDIFRFIQTESQKFIDCNEK